MVCAGGVRLERRRRFSAGTPEDSGCARDHGGRRRRAYDEDLYTPGQMEVVQMLASDKLRDEEGLLRSSQIHAIRVRLGLTQHQFEKLLGVGPKTVVRWEKGTVFQNRATDSLLRLIADVRGAAPYLARLHGVDLGTDQGAEPPPRDRASPYLA